MSDLGEQNPPRVRGKAMWEELGRTAHILATMEANGYIEAGTTDLLHAVSKLRLSDALTDLTIVCGASSWKTQKAVVCTHSGFFELACKEGFKEATTHVVELKEEDEILVQHMMDYMYTLNWAETPIVKTCDHDGQEHSYKTKQCRLYPAKLSIAMHALAEKYDMQGLKKMCIARFEASRWRKLKPEEQLNLTEDVYSITRETDQLRRIVRDSTIDHIKSRAQLQGFQQFLLNTPEFAYDALMSLSVWGKVNRSRYCRLCGRTKDVRVDIEGCDHRSRNGLHDGGMSEDI